MKKYKCFGWLLALSVVAAVPVMAQSTNPSTTPNEELTSLDLMAQVRRAHLLKPSVPIVEQTIDIDEADEVNIIFGSPSKTLKIELISPSGQRFSSGNINSAGVKSLVFPDPANLNATGANYMFVLTQPQVGKWKYVIQDTVTLTKPHGVVVDLFSSSPVRSGMLSYRI